MVLELGKKEDCCGCGLCAAVCPKGCIRMKADREGFVYPEIEKKYCINCNLCERKCPIKNSERYGQEISETYVVQSKDENILMESTAGGAFTSIAQWVISKEGVVCGASMSDDLEIEHCIVSNKIGLKKFRNSKYVQSYISLEVYRALKEYIENGKYVCFSGTPCQVDAVHRYIGENDRLILVDVVCRAVCSPLIFRKYVHSQEIDLDSNFTNIRFRDKFYGYDWPTIRIETDKGDCHYHRGIESDPYLRAFFDNMCDRPSCHTCKYRTVERCSDFTLWDCLRVWRYARELDNGKGASRVLVHTNKGKKIFDDISQTLFYYPIGFDDSINNTKELSESPQKNPRREEFFNDANILDGKELFMKYYPIGMKQKMSNQIRRMFYRLHLYSIGKKIYVFLTRK